MTNLPLSAVAGENHSVDVVARAARPLKMGEIIQEDHALVEALMWSAMPVGKPTPVPLYLAVNNPLTVDVLEGTLLTASMIEKPEGSVLWNLRAQQDQHWLMGEP